jgi:hypothetical protein
MALGCLRLSDAEPSEAVTCFERAVELAGRPPWLVGWLGLACGLAGRAEQARVLRADARYESLLARLILSPATVSG